MKHSTLSITQQPMNYSGVRSSNFPPAVKNLIIINLLFWLATLAAGRMGIDLVGYLGLHYWRSESFNAAQFVSYMFMHDPTSFSHIFFNMFALWMFGKDIENFWGSKRFLLYYFTCGIGAGLIQQLTWAIDLHPLISALDAYAAGGDIELLAPYLKELPASGEISPIEIAGLKERLCDQPVTVGASGAVFGILLAFAMLFPNARIFLLFIPIPIKAPIFVFFYALLELYEGVSNFSGDNVAHFAHLGGMLFGLILILYWKRKGRLN